MIEKAVLQKEIDRLPPQYFGEVIDFVGYLQSKAEQAAVLAVAREQRNARDRELINLHAEELNREMEDVLLDQVPIFE